MEGEKFITPKTEGGAEALPIKNKIQIELAQRLGMDLEEWINKYSDKFGRIFHNEIIADPHFLKHDMETHNATLDRFERELYADSGALDPEAIEEEVESKL